MLQKLGRQTAFIGKVGNDTFGKILKNAVRETGINTDNLLTDNNVPTTLAFANAASAVITTRCGALKVMPEKAEVLSFLTNHI